MSGMNGTGIDKDAHYGRFQKHQDRKNNLAIKAAHKALDIADDDMNITATTNNHKGSGIGTLGAMGIAAVAGLAPVLAIWGMGGMPGIPKALPQVPVMTQPAAQQLDSEWDVEELLADANGKIIQPEKVVRTTRYRSRSGVVEKKLPDGTWEKVK